MSFIVRHDRPVSHCRFVACRGSIPRALIGLAGLIVGAGLALGASPSVWAQAGTTVERQPIATQAAPAHGATSVLLWQAAAREGIAQTKPNQQAALRGLAYLALAQQQAADALQAAAPNAEEAVWQQALDRAAADVLSVLIPARAPAWQGLFEGLSAARPPLAETADLVRADALGREAAQRVLARAAADGFDGASNGAGPDSTDAWRSHLQPPRPPHLPGLGRVRPLLVASVEALMPAPSPARGSAAFERALAEVRVRANAEGAAGAEAQARARRWEMTSGALVAGYWSETAAELGRRDGLGGRELARVLSLTLGAAMDANIACHAAKYRYWVPRPSQVDPAIRVRIALPNHPSYPSNHACDSTAAATVLAALFPSHRAALLAMAKEAGESRIDGGIHYRFDIEAGEAIGRAAAEAVLRQGDVALSKAP